MEVLWQSSDEGRCHITGKLKESGVLKERKWVVRLEGADFSKYLSETGFAETGEHLDRENFLLQNTLYLTDFVQDVCLTSG